MSFGWRGIARLRVAGDRTPPPRPIPFLHRPLPQTAVRLAEDAVVASGGKGDVDRYKENLGRFQHHLGVMLNPGAYPDTHIDTRWHACMRAQGGQYL